ncbi:MAG: hypothetical protein A2017_05060 [Lentisphaerae bacterium GWF2_44_16]|nr:MAG: hypothetical protein A2017_05060 [Lentisphaerae bacterium GWF2_44_16]
MAVRLRKPLKFLSKYLFLFFCGISLFLCDALNAEARVTRAKISMGFSLRMYRYSIAELNCFIENPDNKAKEITLRLFTNEGLAQAQNNFFFDTVKVPASSYLDYKTQVLIENAEQYKLEVFVDGRKSSDSKQTFFLKLLSNKSILVGTVNDDNEASLGGFNQLESFKNEFSVANFNAMSFPENWMGLMDLAALVIVKPDFNRYSSRQLNALLDYVYQGGILIFAEPGALFDAAKTPLAKLLPVVPVRLRKIKELPSLKKIIPAFKAWHGHDAVFLESYQSGDGVDFLTQDDMPVFRWKKFGLGSCRFSAISLCEDNFKQDKKAWELLLKSFFRRQTFYNETELFNSTLDEMTGFPIPEPIVIKTILLVYFLLLVLLIAGGLYFRKSGIAWTSAAFLAFVMTLYVLHRADKESGNRGKLFSFINFRIDGSDTMPMETYCAFFSDTDAKVDIIAKNENTGLSSIPPNRSSFMPQMMGGGADQKKKDSTLGNRISKPLEIQRLSGIQRFQGLDLPTKTSRQFRALLTESSIPFSNALLPYISYTKDTVKMLSWKVPDGKKYEHAFLLMPNGSFILNESGGKLILTGKDTFINTDNIMNSIRNCMENSFRKASPCVALISKATSAPLLVPQETILQGRNIDIIPVTESCESEYVCILPEQIVFTSGDTSSRMVMSGNRLKSIMDTFGTATYSFNFTLPPIFSVIEPDEIILNFTYRNQGGNINVAPLISKNGRPVLLNAKAAPAKKKVAPKTKAAVKTPAAKTKPAAALPVGANPVLAAATVRGVEKETGVFVFKGEGIKNAIDPLTGSGFLILEALEINPDMAASQKMRANKWAPVKLSISVRGHLPKDITPFKY